MKTLVLLMVALFAPTAWAQGIRVAAAADLNPAANEIADAFRKQTGVAVQVSYGSSGDIFSQIKNGAPVDVFLSADSSYPQELVKAGLAGQFTVYGEGTLVLWVSNRTGVNMSGGIRLLLDKRIARIAVANPAHAPYGRAAMAAIEHERLQDALRAKLVYGENVSQAAQFAESGNAQAALIALSSAMRPAMQSAGKYVEVPRASYPPLRQAAVVVSRSKDPKAAASFLQFLQSAAAREILRRHGFRTE